MKFFFIITPVTNIKRKNIIDDSKLEIKSINDTDKLVFWNIEKKEFRRGAIKSVSLQDDEIMMEDGLHYKVLHIFKLKNN